MARQYLRLTTETTWGTFNGAGSVLFIDLDTDNAFTMRPKPVKWKIRTAGVGNRLKQEGSAKTEVMGQLKTLVYGSQQATLMPLLTSSDGTAQLPSFTADHALLEVDGSTIAYRRYLGCRVRQAAFASSEADQLMRLTLDIQAKQPATITITDFAEPAVSDYPGTSSDPPYVLEHGSGGLKIATSRVGFETFNINIANALDARFFESQYIQYLFYCGRTVTWDSRLAYKIQTDRAAFEAMTALDCEALFTNGAHTLKFEMNAQNFLETVEDDATLDKVFTQNLSLETAVDGIAGSDFSIAVT